MSTEIQQSNPSIELTDFEINRLTRLFEILIKADGRRKQAIDKPEAIDTS